MKYSHREMANLLFLVCATATAVLGSAVADNLKWHFDGNTRNGLEFEFLKKIEIERIKAKIMQTLGVEEPPTFPDSLMPLSQDTIEMLIENSKSKTPVQKQNNLASLMIFPKNRDFQCQGYTDSFCRRFEFQIPSDAAPFLKEFWVHAFYIPKNLVTISVLCSHPKQRTQKIFENKDFFNENDQTKWLFYQLPKLKYFNFWHENECSVEIRGIVIDVREHYLPFLKMMKDTETQIRKKKTEGSKTDQPNCLLIPFTVSFKKLGYLNWIVYPEEFEANMCQGYCQETENQHESIMETVFHSNRTFEERYGRCWATCCRPKQYESLNVMYREDNNTFLQLNLVNVIIKECSCS